LVDRSEKKGRHRVKKEPQFPCGSFARRFHPETKLDGRPIDITVHGIAVGAISDIGTKKKGCRRWIGRAAQKRRDQSRSGKTLLTTLNTPMKRPYFNFKIKGTDALERRRSPLSATATDRGRS
jgi:hypothetical protein